MYWAIITTNITRITESWKEIESIRRLYPYPKIEKFETLEEAQKWMEINKYIRPIQFLRNYGNTTKGFTVHASYRITPQALLLKFDLKSMGHLFLREQDDENILIEYSGNIIRVRMNKIQLNNETVDGHMAAVCTLLNFLGPIVDVDIKIQYYSIFYTLTLYSKSNRRLINLALDTIKERNGGVAFTYGDEYS